ncbi:MAG: sugar transporter [Glaciihabitans sp.]|nr:sugar transporter [Glaciihabitans sp.]MDQ1569940.1 type transport system permease protein [Actinomycetota bacterium]
MTDIARQRAERLAAQPLITLASGPGGFFRGTINDLRELWKRRELQGILVRRELKNRYKDSALGFLWTLIKPITMLLVYYFALGQILGASRNTPEYAIFVFAGLTIWGLYADILTSSTMSILQNAALIKKVYMPREVFPLASVGSALLNFCIQFGVLLVAMIVFGQVPVNWDSLYIIPAVLVVAIFGTALALVLSALNVYLRDVQYLVDVMVVLLFWASPVVYAFRSVAGSDAAGVGTWLYQLYLLNPITIAVVAFQRGTWLHGHGVETSLAKSHIPLSHNYPADLDLRLIIAIVVGLVFLWFAHRLFTRLQGNFAQEI